MIKKLKQAFLWVWNWRERLKFKKINKTLEKAVIKKGKKRRDLGMLIMKDVRKFLGIDVNDVSKFIPYDYKTRVRVKAHIDEKYGDEMKELNLNFSDKLKLS